MNRVGSPGRTRIPLISVMSAAPPPIPTGWLIPLTAGLYQLSLFKKTSDASFFDASFQFYCISPGVDFLFPNDFPWSLKSFGRLGKPVLGIVMLSKPSLKIVSLATVIPAGCFTPQYVDAVRHQYEKERPAHCVMGRPVGFWLPGTDSNRRQGG